MLWIILGALTAFFFALLHIASKYAAEKLDPFYLSNAIWISFSVVSIPVILLFHRQIELDRDTFLGLIGMGLLISSTHVIYLQSLRQGDISKTVPLLSITPVFTLAIAMLWLGEFPNIYGMFGIVTIITGNYFINFEHFRKDRILGPFNQLFSDRASRLMLLVAAAYGLGSVTDKFIINHSNIFTRVFLFGYFSLFFTSIYLLFRDGINFFKRTKETFESWRQILLIDLFYFLTLLFQMTGLSMTFTAYIIALKRTSAIFSVIMAYYIFNEKRHFRTALAATILMVIGVFLIAFY